MKKLFLSLVCLCCLLVGIQSCSTTKKTSTVATKTTNGKQARIEYEAFFEAEKARLLGENKNALSLYRTYLATYKTNAAAYFNIGRIQYKMSMSSEAELNAKKAFELEPSNKFYAEFYADVLSYNLKFEEALQLNNKLIALHPNNEEYLYKKSQLYIRLQKYDKAIDAINETEQKVGINDDLIMQKKQLYIKQGNIDAAANELKKLIQQDPLDPRYYIITADMYDKNKQPEKAAKAYQEIEEKFSNEPMAQVSIAKYYLEHNNTEGYNKYMKQVMQSKDLDVDTKIAFVIPLLQKINTDSNVNEQANILNMVKSIYDAEPLNKSAINLYADVLYFSKKEDEAIKIYENYLAVDKTKFNAWSQLMNIYTSKREHDSVISISKRSLDYFPNNSLTYFYRGLAFSQKKENVEAIKNYKKAIDLNSENKELLAQNYSSLADVYNTEKDFIKSDSCFEKALKLLPEDASTLNNYAYYLSVRNERLVDAEKMSKKSLELAPNQKSFLDTYGWILFKQKNYLEAKDYILQAIKANGESDGTLYDHLGDVYYFLNDKEKALENWQLANQKGENNPTLLKKINDKTYYE
jgi:tetratricopeptide (TPR) repeat protein